MKGHAYLEDESLSIQRKAYEVFYLCGLKDGVAEGLGLGGGEMFAYRRTGGSNLDLPDVYMRIVMRAFSVSPFIRNTTSFYVFPPILPPPH